MKLARWCYRRRVVVVVAWVVALVFVNGIVAQIGADYSGDPEPPESESKDGFEILEQYFTGIGGGPAGTIVFKADQGIDAPEVRAALEPLFALATEGGATVGSPYDGFAFGQVNDDRTVAFARVEFTEDVTFSETSELGHDLADARPLDVPGLQVEIGGEVLAGFEPPESETIGLAFAVVILIVSFGSVIAMGMPIAVAIAGVSLGLGFAGILSNVASMPDFATVIGAMIGLGVGIDYALFIVTRFRESMHEGHGPEVATAAAMDTAGRSVIFAGVTVVASLLGLLLIGLPFVAGLGIAAAVTVASTMAASTTLLPALLGFARLKVEITKRRGLVAAGMVSAGLLGIGLKFPVAALLIPLAVVVAVVGTFIPFLNTTLPPRKNKPIRESGWYRWSHLIQDNPWPFAIGGTLLLVIISLPLAGIRLGFSDEGNYPEDSTTRQAYDLLTEGFGPGFNGPFFAVAELAEPDDLTEFQQIIDAIAADPGVAELSPLFPNTAPDPQAVLVRINPTTSPQSVETEELIKRLRDEVVPAAASDGAPRVILAGFVTASVDFSTYLAGRSLFFFAVVLILSFLLLMAVFRSLLVPLKAVIMNMLSISGAYGIVVAIFQWGWFKDILGIEPAPIEPFIPMMMFAIVFGLSMDYEVFLLSRIKEEYERSGDAKNSVADGLASTARVISAAAAIMVVVFGSFLLEDQRVTKVFGTGLGMAVLLDATLVRMLLVPATMELLGERNWWLPKALDRLLPNLNVEGSPDHEERLAVIEAEVAAEEAEAPVEAPVAEPVGAGRG